MKKDQHVRMLRGCANLDEYSETATRAPDQLFVNTVVVDVFLLFKMLKIYF